MNESIISVSYVSQNKDHYPQCIPVSSRYRIMPKPMAYHGTIALVWLLSSVSVRALAARYYFILFWRYYSVQTSSNLNLSKLQSFNYLLIAEVRLNWQLLSSESLSVFTCSGFSLCTDRCCSKTTLAWKLRQPNLCPSQNPLIPQSTSLLHPAALFNLLFSF